MDDYHGRCPRSNTTGHEICVPLVFRQPRIEDVFASCDNQITFEYLPKEHHMPNGLYSGMPL